MGRVSHPKARKARTQTQRNKKARRALSRAQKRRRKGAVRRVRPHVWFRLRGRLERRKQRRRAMKKQAQKQTRLEAGTIVPTPPDLIARLKRS